MMPRTAAVNEIMAAASCDRNMIVHPGDHLVTEYRQAGPANNLWEQPMLMKHSSGSANAVARRYDVATDEGSLAGKNRLRVPRLDLEIDLVGEARCRKAGFWSSVLDFLIEGFALCAASSHPTIFLPPAPHLEEQEISTARDISLCKWRGSQHSISPLAKSVADKSTPCRGSDRDAGQATPDTYAAVTDHGWREREREIEEAIAALSRLDDRTLQMLGIPHRSCIEQTVRYCHDC
jgi:hypothetical protein